MYNPQIHKLINNSLQKKEIDIAGKDNLFYTRMVANTTAIHYLYNQLYQNHPHGKPLILSEATSAPTNISNTPGAALAASMLMLFILA